MALGGLRQDDFAAGMALLEQARAEAGGDPARTADIQLGISDIFLRQGDRPRALAAAKDALAEAERAGDTELIAIALAQVYDYTWMSGLPADERQLDRRCSRDGGHGGLCLRSASWVRGYVCITARDGSTKPNPNCAPCSGAEADGVEYCAVRCADAAVPDRRPAREAAEAAELAPRRWRSPSSSTLRSSPARCCSAGGCGAPARGQRRGPGLAERGPRWRARRRPAEPPLAPVAARLAGPGAGRLPRGGRPAPSLTARGARDRAASHHPGHRAGRGRGLHRRGRDRRGRRRWWPSCARSIHEPVTAALAARCRGMLAAAHGDLDGAAERAWQRRCGTTTR